MKRALVLLALILAARPVPAAVDPFYQSLLLEGVQQYDRGDYAASARTLRIACFGMLDEPQRLAGCLSRLALAQDRVGDAEGFQDTFRRLAEVEERFQAYTQAELPAEARAALEQRLAARIPAATLRSIPAFRPLADRKEAQAQPEPKPRRGQRGSAEEIPPPTRVSAAPPPASSSAAAGPGKVSAEPAGPRVMSAAERDRMAAARRVLQAQDSKVRDLKQAYEMAREVADAHPESVEAQHLAAEAAYRISRWADAARYFRRGGEPGENQPELQFYMAVALFESGDAEAAAAILRRSLPNLQRTPYVDSYARRILG